MSPDVSVRFARAFLRGQGYSLGRRRRNWSGITLLLLLANCCARGAFAEPPHTLPALPEDLVQVAGGAELTHLSLAIELVVDKRLHTHGRLLTLLANTLGTIRAID